MDSINDVPCEDSLEENVNDAICYVESLKCPNEQVNVSNVSVNDSYYNNWKTDNDICENRDIDKEEAYMLQLCSDGWIDNGDCHEPIHPQEEEDWSTSIDDDIKHKTKDVYMSCLPSFQVTDVNQTLLDSLTKPSTVTRLSQKELDEHVLLYNDANNMFEMEIDMDKNIEVKYSFGSQNLTQE